MSSLQTIVLLSSVIYHNNLINNFRNYDICITCSIIAYHLYIYLYYFLMIDLTPGIFYILGIRSYYLGVKINCNYMHGYLHIFGIIGNILVNNLIKSPPTTQSLPLTF